MKKKYIFRQFRILFFLLLSVLTTNPLFPNSYYNNHNVPTASYFVDLNRIHNRIENKKKCKRLQTKQGHFFREKLEFGVIENSTAWTVTNLADKTSVNLVRMRAANLSLLEKIYILLRQFNI